MTPALAAIRALPYVKGESRRSAATPTKLTPLAGQVMVASGALSTPRKVASFPMLRIAGLIVLVVIVGAYFLVGDPNSVETQKAEMTRSEISTFEVCVLGQQRAMAAECPQEARARLPDPASAANDVERQDRLEIDRFIRLRSAVRHDRTVQHRSGSHPTSVSAR
jgi:hypothetical protein